MTVPPQRSRRWPGGPGVALRVLLAVALLVPTGMLFSQVWRTNDDQRTVVERERAGVVYLRSLVPVTIALVDAQSAAVTGRPVPGDALANAVEGTAAVDARLGTELRGSERWAGVRAKIEALSARDLTDPTAVFTAYGETTDLLLDLHNKIRTSSGLIQDPEPDSYHLQDAVAEELPEALVTAGRLADLASIAKNRRSSERLRTAGELAVARAVALDPADDLVDGLHAAVDGTDSRTLGGRLLTELDGYQRAVQALGASAAPPNTDSGIDPAQVAAARTGAQAASAQLAMIILDELDVLLATRGDELAGRFRMAVTALALAVLLVAALAGPPLLGARRRPVPATDRTSPGPDVADRPPGDLPAVLTPEPRRPRPADQHRPADLDGPGGTGNPRVTGGWPEPVAAGQPVGTALPHRDRQATGPEGRI